MCDKSVFDSLLARLPAVIWAIYLAFLRFGNKKKTGNEG